MGSDPNDILTWDILDGLGEGLDDVPASDEEEVKTCPDCKGKKIIYLFYTYEPCTLCRGTGRIVVHKDD